MLFPRLNESLVFPGSSPNSFQSKDIHRRQLATAIHPKFTPTVKEKERSVTINVTFHWL